jgi:hypothetical protein
MARMDLETALITYLIAFSAAAGIGLLAWLLITLTSMATSAATAAGAGGISLTIKRVAKGK